MPTLLGINSRYNDDYNVVIQCDYKDEKWQQNNLFLDVSTSIIPKFSDYSKVDKSPSSDCFLILLDLLGNPITMRNHYDVWKETSSNCSIVTKRIDFRKSLLDKLSYYSFMKNINLDNEEIIFDDISDIF
ncbi:MAG: hypothetical protein ACYCXB_05510 [Candidatus Humimicrobiaceae bacterium]